MQNLDVQDPANPKRSPKSKVPSAMPEKWASVDQVIPIAPELKARALFLGEVPLAEIVVSKTNPRHEFNDLDELTASILREGGR